jgi:hypothetical protein
MAYKTFVAGEEALASDANAYLMSQAVPRFTNAAQRTSQLTAPVLNQLSMLDAAPGRLDAWSGSAWVAASAGAELFYNEITASKNIASVNAAFPDIVVDGSAVSYDGSPVLVEFFAYSVNTPGVAASRTTVNLYDAGSNLGDMGLVYTNSAAGNAATLYACRRITPTVGSHTYRAGAFCAPSGNSVVSATAQSPAFLRVSRA